MNQSRQILRIALPSIISNITVPLLGLVDVAITGHMASSTPLAAIAVASMLFNVIYWPFAFLRMGTSGMTAQAFGANNLPEVSTLLRQSLLCALSISLLLLCLQLPIREVSLLLISPTDEVAQLSRTYFNICIWGAPASLMLFAMSGWFLGMQNSKAPMAIAIAQNLCNILLSTFFVYALHWQIEGIALGTVLSQYFALLLSLILFLPYRHILPQHHGTLTHIGRFFRLNRDIFLRTLCLIFVHFYFISTGAHYGDTSLAINALLMQLFLLYSYIMDGFAFAGEALVGKAIGARDRTTLHHLVRQLFLWGTIVMLLFTIAYATFDHEILSLLTDQSDILALARDYHLWALLLPLCGMMAFIWDGIYIGATATRPMLISMFLSMLLFLLLTELLSPTFGNHALWFSFNAYILSRGIIQTILYFRA